jgi:hypothetical protein
MSTPLPEDKLVEIKEAIYRGRKIEAIKIYRESTRVQLVDAKAEVDKLEEELRATRPENFMRTGERRGCLGVLAAALLMAGIIVIWVTAR